MGDTAYWIWFHKIFGATVKGKKLLESYKCPKKIYDAIIRNNKKSELFSPLSDEELKFFSIVDAEEIVEQCFEKSWTIITRDSPYYPKLLLDIKDSPSVLFADGICETLSAQFKVTIVGSRNASIQGRNIAYKTAEYLSKNSVCVASGAAAGIDLSAHQGALAAKGPTVAVLGCGLGSEYMFRMGSFYKKIKENGVLITEMFPFENASRYSFPKRNRILSGISSAVLVIDAGNKSGALITAKKAIEQRRMLFATAPEIHKSAGCETLLKEGAYPFYKAGDIIYPLKDLLPDGCFNERACLSSVKCKLGDELALGYFENIEEKNKAAKTLKRLPKKPLEAKPMDNLSKNALKVLEILGDKILYADDICERTGFSVSVVMDTLTELEIDDFVEILPGSRISKIH